MGYSFRLTARVLLYASSHRQDNTYHGLYYTSLGALAGTRFDTDCHLIIISVGGAEYSERTKEGRKEGRRKKEGRFYLRLYGVRHMVKEGRKEMFYLTTHSTHFIYGYMASDIW